MIYTKKGRYMKQLVAIIIFSSLIFTQSSENQSFKLIDGTVINGTVIDKSNDTITIQTQYGTVTINHDEIVQTQYTVKLQSGETLIGTKSDENDTSITLETSLGTLRIQKSDIVNIQELGKVTSSNVEGKSNNYRRPYSLTNFLFGGSAINKEMDFALGEEQLIDLFFDPTGYTLAQSTLYLSGLSFGFGVTDNFHITTKWGGFFWGDMNLRPKFKVFEIGNWQNQHALSIGAHYHTRWKPNKYEWKSGSVQVIEFTGVYDDYGDSICPGDGGDYCWKQTAKAKTDEKYWGGYYPIGEEPNHSSIKYNYPDEYDSTAIDTYYDHEPYQYNSYDYNEGDSYLEMLELFGAYTYSKARPGLKGRISHTLGGNMQYVTLNNEATILYRAYYGFDLDINAKLKMIGELFYDPNYLELWQKWENDVYYWSINDYSENPVSEKGDYSPIHLDFGFIYALNESFRFGLHFQEPFVAFYWKL